MKLLFGLLFLTSILQMDRSSYDFETILRNDRTILDKQKNTVDLSFLGEFDKFAQLRQTTIPAEQKIGHHTVTTISAKDNPEIISITKIVTSFDPNPDDNESELQQSDFNFTAYQFKTKKKTFLYVSLKHQGLVQYNIAEKEYVITYSMHNGYSYIYPAYYAEIRKILGK